MRASGFKTDRVTAGATKLTRNSRVMAEAFKDVYGNYKQYRSICGQPRMSQPSRNR